MIPAAISSLTESAQIEGKLKNPYCRMCFGFTSRIRLLDRHPWLAVVTFPAVSRELTISNENHCLRSVIELPFTYAKDIRMLVSVDMQASDTST